MGADYFASEAQSGDAVGSEGYLVVNGNVYPANSGPWTARDGTMAYGTGGDVPPGHYTYGDPKAESGKSYNDPKAKKGSGVFFPIGTGPDGTGAIPDGRPGHARSRSDIGFHFDGGNPGTNGCIGYQDSGAKDDLISNPDKTVDVHYESNLTSVQSAVVAKVGHPVNFDDVEKNRRHIPGFGDGTGVHSQTKKGHKVKKGVTHVRLGPRHRHTAHHKAELEGGNQVAEGSKSVFVGPERFQVARVNDQTTDGSPLADGEGSILVG